MDKYEDQITDYVYNLKYEDLTDKAIYATKERVLDSFACGMAAYDKIPVKAMREIALNSSAVKGATAIGTTHITTVYDAAILLGTMIRAHDWNDTYLAKEPAHPSDNISAAMATAEYEGLTGKELILGIVLGYEMQCRLCDAAAIRKKGWDHVTYASVSCTSAAARLMGLSKEQIRDALGIAITTGNYLRQTRIGEISNWKAAAFAKAAKNALESALYVKHGFTGPYDIITGQHGLINEITKGEFDLAEKLGGQDGEEFKIVETYIKYFPAEYHSQSTIWAALDVRKQMQGRSFKDIESITIETSFHSYEIIGMEPAKWRPKTKETADHSMPYITVVTLIDGDITLKQYDEEHLNNKEILDMVQKVKVVENKEYTAVYGKSFPNKVVVKMKDGAIFENECRDPKGHPLNPLSKEEIETKFRKACTGLISEDRMSRIIEIVWDLKNLKNIKELIDCFVVV